MKKTHLILAATALSVLASHAATITWSSAPYTNTGSFGQFLGTGQFATTGTQWVAENSGGSAVVFDGINFADASFMFTGEASVFHQGGQTLSQDGTHGDASADTVTIGNGTTGAAFGIGNTYRIQLLVADGRGNAGITGRTVEVDGVNQGTYANGVTNVTWGDFLLVTGTFVADSATQSFTVETFDGTTSKGGMLNALLVHETAVVPEPSSAALLGLGGLALMFRRRK